MFAIDLTSDKVIVAYLHEDDVQLWSFSWNAVFTEDEGSVNISIGKDEENIDEKTVMLGNLRENFPRINNNDVQTEITAKLLAQIAEIVGHDSVTENPITNVIVPYGYSSKVLDAIEAGFQTGSSGMVLRSLINECVATIIYFFESDERFNKLNPDPSGETFCFINATTSPVKAFLVDYHQVENNLSFVVRDYFVAPELYDKTEFPKVSVSGLKTVVFGDLNLINPAGKVVDALESQDKCRVMVAGATLLGLGKLKSERTYSIAGAMVFGIQTGRDSFYEIIPKDLLLSDPKMPIKRSKAFLIDNITHDININLYCGFSNKLSGALNLGTITLMESWFPDGKAEVVVTVELDSMHSGRFSVTHNPDPIVKSFNVPGWLG
jgi:hypothetical protein